MPIATVAFSPAERKSLSAKTLRRVQAAMAKDGAVRFARLFSPSLLKKIRREVLRRDASGELRARGLVRDIAGRYTCVVPFEGPFLSPEFYADRRVLEIMTALLGSTHCIGSLEVVVARPGAVAQHQHVDGPLRFDRVIGKKKEGFHGDLSGLPPYAVGLAVPLCDVDEDNGPTAIWAGSHRTALRPRPPGEAAILRDFPEERMTCDFGGAYLFDYRVFHGGLPNYSREPRPLLMFVFTRAWFRDPNLNDVFPSVVIAPRAYRRIPARRRSLFLLAPAARRALWDGKRRKS